MRYGKLSVNKLSEYCLIGWVWFNPLALGSLWCDILCHAKCHIAVPTNEVEGDLRADTYSGRTKFVSAGMT